MFKAIGNAGIKAIELNQRAGMFSLSKDGLSFVALDGLSPSKTEAGAVDHAKTANDHLKLARDYALVGVLPEKAAIGTALGMSPGGVKAVGGSLLGATVGALVDVVEAVPNLALAAVYLGSSGLHALKR